MTRTQIQFPDSLYQRLKIIAEQRDWSLAEVMRKAAEHFVRRFPESATRGDLESIDFKSVLKISTEVIPVMAAAHQTHLISLKSHPVLDERWGHEFIATDSTQKV